jgi:hypothetical protein
MKRFRLLENGQSLVEYSAILIVIAIIAVVTYPLWGPSPARQEAAENLAGSLPSNSTYAEPYSPPTGRLIDTGAAFDLTNASKSVGGAYAYWESDQNGRDDCFFGIHSSLGWTANSLPGPCPSSPDDDARIGELIQKLWNSFSDGRTWSDLLATRAAEHVKLIIEVAKLYGITLVP